MSGCSEFCIFHINHGRFLFPSSNWPNMDTVLYALQVYLFEPKVWDGKTLSCTVPFVLDVVRVEGIVGRDMDVVVVV